MASRRWSESFEAAKSACGQCPHFGRRIGSYVGRIGPDSACFRGPPVFAGAGIPFESHLGHSVSAGQGSVRSLTVDKKPKSVGTGLAFLCGKCPQAREKDGTSSFMVLTGNSSKSPSTQSSLIRRECRLLPTSSKSTSIYWFARRAEPPVPIR